MTVNDSVERQCRPGPPPSSCVRTRSTRATGSATCLPPERTQSHGIAAHRSAKRGPEPSRTLAILDRGLGAPLGTLPSRASPAQAEVTW
jgi:hypothetical protein